MFTFCFTSVATAQMRRIRKTPKTTRTTDALRTVKLGLATLAVLATASMAQAGGFSAHLTGSSSSNNGNHNNGSSFFSQSGQSKFNQGSNKFDTNKLDQHQTTVIDNLKNNNQPININNQQNPNKISLNLNTDKNPIKLTGDKTDKVKLGDKIKLTMGDKSKDKVKFFCDPSHKHCCPWWYCWNYPCWYPLYGCGCGDYCDVPVVEIAQGLDLQLLAVRTIDSGDPSQQLGPALRVWFRNNSAVAINHPFNVLALAARDAQPTADLPQAGVRVESIEAGQTMAVDIRLPVEANQPGFPMFHVLVDSHREIPEANETNNGLVINRSEVQPVEIAQTTPSGGSAAAGGTQDPPAPPTGEGTEGAKNSAANAPAPVTPPASVAGLDDLDAE